MMKYLLGGAAAAAMVAIAPAFAQAPTPVRVMPQTVDRAAEPGWQVRTSVHTRAEVAAHVRKLFDRLDGNRDGSVTKAEAEAAKAHRGERRAMRMQRRGGEGRTANRSGMFDRLDTNRDGSISREEFAQAPARQERRMIIRTDRNNDGRPDGARAMRGMRMGMGMGGLGGRMFDLADANRDGRVTLQEATNAALRHFDTADVNRDGRLTPEERMQTRQRIRAERRPG